MSAKDHRPVSGYVDRNLAVEPIEGSNSWVTVERMGTCDTFELHLYEMEGDVVLAGRLSCDHATLAYVTLHPLVDAEHKRQCLDLAESLLHSVRQAGVPLN